MHRIAIILKTPVFRCLGLFLLLAAAGCAHTKTEPAPSAPAAPTHTTGALPPETHSRRTMAFENRGIEPPSTAMTNSVDREFKKLMDADDLAQEEVDGWIKENQEFARQGAGKSPAEMRQRILTRFEPIQKSYEDFIQRHPDHVAARIAFASFLGDIGEEEAGMEQLEKARELDPNDPAIWNNLANYYGHNGPVTNAFVYYEKAIQLDPKEPVYLQNFATTVYLFRRDAESHYHIEEPQVFDKALDLLRRPPSHRLSDSGRRYSAKLQRLL